MEQIYYTQCPVGHGLGASNGFQVKRLSGNYPVSGDFRHLGLRAFPGGGRSLAPPTLRFRREGEIPEVAWLTPRSHEYETERGLWGRPGGLFAHGLRLQPSELAPIHHWPAGLFESPIWCRSDREPTRGQPPPPIELTTAALFRPPEFAEVAPLAEGLEPSVLARLLTALAMVAREGRTLFLIDEPDRLGPRIALLTFAFPEPFRSELTFSTYHDRPEELPGYRIQGTIPAARPNRAALLALGVVADLIAGSIEPRIEPASWASTLAGWLVDRGPIAEVDWSATEARASRRSLSETKWTDDWLGYLIGFPEAQRHRTPPDDPAGWTSLGGFAEWVGPAGMGVEWIRERGPTWWRGEAARSRGRPEARSALVSHATLREAWAIEGDPAGWGRAVGEWFRDADAEERDGAILHVFRAVPDASRPSFARALLQSLTLEGTEAVLERLRSEGSCDRAMLLPIEAATQVTKILEGGDPRPLRELLKEALPLRGATSAILDAVEAGLSNRPEALDKLAVWVSVAFELGRPGGGREGLAWALRRPKDRAKWLGPTLRPLFADLGRQREWPMLLDRTSQSQRAELVGVVLEVARDPRLPHEAFRWGVEALLLPMEPRPHDRSWAETYLKRTPSGLDLLKRLGSPEYRKLNILSWLKMARARGELSEEQAARLDSCLEYGRALASSSPDAFEQVSIPSVPPREQGVVLGQMLARLDRASSTDPRFVLNACRDSWPGAFQTGAPGLAPMAEPIARWLLPHLPDPPTWFDRLVGVLRQVGIQGPNSEGFEPDGLAAEIVAASSKLGGKAPTPWPLRQFLLARDPGWRILAADLRGELGEAEPNAAPRILEEWDDRLAKGGRPERFLELVFNVMQGSRLVSCVLTKAAELKTLPPLPWWDHVRHLSSLDDLRDGFARLAPFAPLPEGQLFQFRAWVESPTPRANVHPVKGLPPGLSPAGLARWRCLEALTNFVNALIDGRDPWQILRDWKGRVPMEGLTADDRHRMLAWVIRGLEAGESYQFEELSSWLKTVGVTDHARLARWAEELEGLVEVPDSLRIDRMKLVGDFQSELRRKLRHE